MRFASFVTAMGSRFGLIEEDKIYDLTKRADDRFRDLKAMISAGAFDELRHLSPYPSDAIPLDEVTFAPVIPNPTKIMCVGINYDSHRKEVGREKSPYPVIFTRFADTQIGHRTAATLPKVSDQLDFEGELAVIIGKAGRYISKEVALQHVAGYSVYNDITVRDWQRHTHQFTPGKNFPGTGAFGPWLVTASEIENPQGLELTTRLNGEVMQHESTSSMTFDVASLIEYCSSFTRLLPGDVIATGTPGGVGFKREPQMFMKPGDRIEVEISAIGKLENTVGRE